MSQVVSPENEEEFGALEPASSLVAVTVLRSQPLFLSKEDVTQVL